MADKKKNKRPASASVSAPQPTPARPLPSELWIAVALGLITLAVYAPVRNFQFTNYDDPDFVTANPVVQAGFTAHGFAWVWTSEVARNWHPITMLSHMFDCQLFHIQPWWPHIENAMFHAANAALLFPLLARMTGAVWRSATVAALFALHPLHVESVAWVAERKDVLSTFFWFLTTMAYVRYAEGGGRPKLFYLLSLLLCALGLMSKPMLVTLPFTLLLFDFWPLERMKRGVGVGKLVMEKLPFLTLSAALCVITYRIQDKGGSMLGLENFSLASRVGNSLVSYLRYLEKMVWPHNLAALYLRHGEWPFWMVAGAAVALLAISIFVLTQWKRRPYLAVGWFWYAGTLVPVCGFVQVGMQSMADRYTYIPLIGIFIMLAWGIWEMVEKTAYARFVPIGAAAVFALCATLTIHQEQYWRDSETLFKRMIDATPANYMARYNLGNLYSREHRSEEAISNLTVAVTEEPNYAEARNNLGAQLLEQKRFDEAIEQYRIALRIHPDYLFEFNLANSLADAASARHDTNLFAEAVATYRKALEMNPNAMMTHYNLGLTLEVQGRVPEALVEFEEAAKLEPNRAETWIKLGMADSMQHRMPEAERAFRELIRIQPNNAEAHGWIGNALAEQGKFADAIPLYQAALKLNPNDARVEFNLALTYLRLNDNTQAAEHFRQAIRIDPNYKEAQAALQQINGAR